MTTTRFRSAAALTVAGLAAAALPLMTAGTADAATTVKSKSYNYDCNTTAGGSLPLGVQKVKVAPTFTIPSLYQGQTVPKTKVGIALTLPEELRDATVNLLKGKKVSGSSDDAKLNITAGDSNVQFPINDLKAVNQPVPQKKAAWVIKTTGTSPAIPVPAVSSLTLGMPTQFTINATVKGDNPDTPVFMDCKLTDASNTIVTVSVRNKTTLTATTSPSTIKAKKTTPYVTVTAKSATTPTGTVAVYKGTKKLGAGKLAKGKVKVKLAKFSKKGKVTLTIKYAGDKTAVDTSITKSVTVK